MAQATNTPRVVLVGAALGFVVLILVVKQFTRDTEHGSSPERSGAQAPSDTSHDWSPRRGDESGTGGTTGFRGASRRVTTSSRAASQAGASSHDERQPVAPEIVQPGTIADEMQHTGDAPQKIAPVDSEGVAGSDRAVPGEPTGADTAPSSAEAGQHPQEDADQPARPKAPESSSLIERATYFSGDDQRFPIETQFQIPDSEKIVGQTGSFAVVVQPGWNQESQDDASIFEVGESGPHLFRNVNFLRFQFLDADGREIGTGTNIGSWGPDERHVLTATWGGGQLALYVDGELTGQQVYSGELNFKDGTPALVGSNFSEGRPVAPGVLSEVQLYNFPLAAGDAARLAKKLNPGSAARP